MIIFQNEKKVYKIINLNKYKNKRFTYLNLFYYLFRENIIITLKFKASQKSIEANIKEREIGCFTMIIENKKDWYINRLVISTTKKEKKEKTFIFHAKMNKIYAKNKQILQIASIKDIYIYIYSIFTITLCIYQQKWWKKEEITNIYILYKLKAFIFL